MSAEDPVLYVLTCATPAAREVGTLVTLAQERGWRVCVIATPVQEAGHARRTSSARRHDRRRREFNTLNKWALGIADTLALGLLTEGLGLDIPIAALPFLNATQITHPAFTQHVETLRSAGVTVLLGPGGYKPHPPHEGSGHLHKYPWHTALDALERS